MEQEQDWREPLIKDCLISEIIRSNSPDFNLPELSQTHTFEMFPQPEETELNCAWNSPLYPSNDHHQMDTEHWVRKEALVSQPRLITVNTVSSQPQSSLPMIPIKQETIYPQTSKIVRQRFYVSSSGNRSKAFSIVRRSRADTLYDSAKYGPPLTAHSPSPPSSDASSSSDVYCHSLNSIRNRSKMHELALAHNLISEQDSREGCGRLCLSAEEKRTMLQEGFALPSRLPLTKQEEDCLKLVRRKIKNKLSAQESRRKRKEYMESLEERVQDYHGENASLRVKLRQLEQNNRSLTAHINKMKKEGQGVSNRATQTDAIKFGSK